MDDEKKYIQEKYEPEKNYKNSPVPNKDEENIEKILMTFTDKWEW